MQRRQMTISIHISAFALVFGAAACQETHHESSGSAGLAQSAAGKAAAGADGADKAGKPASDPAATGGGGQSGQKAEAGNAAAGKPALGGGGRGGNGGKHGEAGTGAAGQQPSDDDAGTSQRCGTRGGVTCGSGQFCNFGPDVDCGATDKGGLCEPKPEVCTAIYKPVCGCDNRSYASDCVAHGAGVSVKHEEACSAAECESSGGRSELSNGASTPMCNANEASWPIAGTIEGGVCCLPQPVSKTCGGIAALKCKSGEFCNYELEAGGQGCDGKVADSGGTCQPKPGPCTKDYKPVCGCDHRSYGNLCTAHAAGVSVLHTGMCTVSDCKAVDGRAVDGIGPPPMCASDEREYTSIVYDDGSLATEGTACCVKK